jgi:phosphatidylglycerophosphate synthase
MIDARLLPVIKTVLQRPARALSGLGVSADSVTFIGFGFGLIAVFAVSLGWMTTALVFLLLNRLCDGLDGTIARLSKPTDRGAFLDIALDFVFYALFPLGFALLNPTSNALPAAVLIAAFVGTGSSFLAFATISAKRGETAAAFPSKGIYYLGGLTEGAETIALFVVMCLLPEWFAPLAYGFALACAVTTVLRWLQGWRSFGP